VFAFLILIILYPLTQWAYFMQILVINTTVRNACMSGDLLATAEELLTQDIDANPDNYNSYANRAIVLARIAKWDHALQDADKVRCTDPS